MELKKPVGDVDDLIFQDAWEVSQRKRTAAKRQSFCCAGLLCKSIAK